MGRSAQGRRRALQKKAMNSEKLTHGQNPSKIPQESKTTSEQTNNQTSSEILPATSNQIQQETLCDTGIQSAAVTLCEINETPLASGSQNLSEKPCEMANETNEKDIHDLSSQAMQCETTSQSSQEMSCETGSQDSDTSEIRIKTEIKEEPVSDNENFQSCVRNLEVQIKSEPSSVETQPLSSPNIMKEEALKDNLLCTAQSLESQILNFAKQGLFQSSSHHNQSPGIVKRKNSRRFNRPFPWDCRQDRSNNSNLSPVNPGSAESNEVYFCLTVSNFPSGWSGLQVKNYVMRECGGVDKFEIISDAEMNFTGSIQLKFRTLMDCMLTKSKLNGKVLEGQTLAAEMNVSDSDEDSDSDLDSTTTSQEPARKRKKRNKERPWKPEIDVWESDPRGLYGFKPRFLQSLGITPPVGKWVQVTNFRCGKAELQEVMQLAGEVVSCSLVVEGSPYKYANVMYSHPLEAVQAVSMINNQMFYGLTLKVQMDPRALSDFVLPKGLNAVGPGLGITGKPIRDIVRQYERYAKGRSSQINSVLFRSTDEIFANNDRNVCNSPLNQASVPQSQIPRANALNQNVVTPLGQSNPAFSAVPQVAGPSGLSRHVVPIRPAGIPVQAGNLAPSAPVLPTNRPQNIMSVNLAGLPNIVPSNSTPRNIAPSNFGLRQVMSQNVTTINCTPQNVMPSNPGPQNIRPLNLGPQNVPMNLGPQNVPTNPGPPLTRPFRPPNVTVEVSNMPLSTTFAVLSQKMSQCGELVSLQLTTPGCAVVQYSNKSEAEKCYDMGFQIGAIRAHQHASHTFFVRRLKEVEKRKTDL